MIKHAAIATALLALAAGATEAQGRGSKKNGKVPPGHMPPAGQCRVWYDGVPPGHQPPPSSCAEAERMAARSDRAARVIYSDGRDSRDSREQGAGGGIFDRYPGDDRRYPGEARIPDDRTDRRRPTDDGRRTGGRAIPRTPRYPSTSGDTHRPAGRVSGGLQSTAMQSGYRDGLEKGAEDASDRDSYDPNRHAWYRSADRGFERRYGTKESYQREYRRGFLEGYEAAYRR